MGDAATRAGLALGQALAAIGTAPPLSAYRGPVSGPRARPPAQVVFVAADLTDGDIATVARGVQQAVAAIGWPPLQILDGQGTNGGQAQALESALNARPGGIILGGFDAAGQQRALREARAQGVPVVGWHAAPEPGPDPKAGLFTNVSADPGQLARATADYVIAGSKGSAGAVILTDPEYAFDTSVSSLLASDMRSCRHCSVQVVDLPIATAPVQTVSATAVLLHELGGRFGYLLALNGAYIEGARIALVDAGRSGDQPPFCVSVGGGNEAEFSQIRADSYQKASVAEPLDLEGWQLVDEINRARAGRPPSGYVPPPYVITQSDVPNSGNFDPTSGYQENYLHIWGR